MPIKIHLVDATYELFRNYYGAPKRFSPRGREIGATVGVVRSLLSLLRRDGATHVACAFDRVIRSFRNDLFEGYKSGEDVDPLLKQQFTLAEKAVSAIGLVVWPAVELEADDWMASGAERWKGDPAVGQVILCSPDKDLAQCVSGNRVVCLDRRRRMILNERGVEEKFGVPPAAIPDFLALVGDAADGIPGIPGWGKKSAATVLSRYGSLEDIPLSARAWDVSVRRAETLADNLRVRLEDAQLYKQLAILRTDARIEESLADLAWKGVRNADLRALSDQLGPQEIDRILSSQ